MKTKTNKVIRPLKPTKTKPGGYLVFPNRDETKWVVAGHNCACAVSMSVPRGRAVDYALAHPEIWL